MGVCSGFEDSVENKQKCVHVHVHVLTLVLLGSFNENWV